MPPLATIQPPIRTKPLLSTTHPATEGEEVLNLYRSILRRTECSQVLSAPPDVWNRWPIKGSGRSSVERTLTCTVACIQQSSCRPTKAYDCCHSTLVGGESIVYDSSTIFRRTVHYCARHDSAWRRVCRCRYGNRWLSRRFDPMRRHISHLVRRYGECNHQSRDISDTRERGWQC
jgi:hypothetical protein